MITRRTARSMVAVAAVTVLGTGIAQPMSANAAALSVDMKVLVLTLSTDQPTETGAAWTDALRREGVKYDVATSIPPLTVAGDANHGAYNGVVIADDTSHFSGLPGWADLQTYETTFGVRQIDGYEWARAVADMGLVQTASGGDASGDAALTPAGLAAFPYLKGPVGLGSDPWVEGLAGGNADFTPFLTWNGQNLIGVWNDPTNAGRQELAITVDYNQWMLHWRLLSPGLIDWVTKGVHFGYNRNYLAMQIDDMFLSDELWNTEQHCTPGETPPDPYCGDYATGTTARLSGKDLNNVVKWENSHNSYQLTFAFNAFGASVKSGGGGNDGEPDGGLTDTALKQKSKFGWVNHTWDHPFFGQVCVNGTEIWNWTTLNYDCSGDWVYPDASFIADELRQDQTWAARNKLPASNYHDWELVTPEHSGLDNPNLAAGLADPTLLDAIRDVASDASRPTADTSGVPASVGLSPRYPNNIYYNVATWEQEIDEYNTIYLPSGLGGRCVGTNTTTCRSAPATKQDIVDSETGIIMGHILGNDPRLSFAHQSNLVGENGHGSSVLLGLLDNVWQVYYTYFQTNTPLVNHSLTDAAEQLALDEMWQSDQAGVTGTISGRHVTISNAGAGTSNVPITVPDRSKSSAKLSPYAGSLSAWQAVAPGSTLTVNLDFTYI